MAEIRCRWGGDYCSRPATHTRPAKYRDGHPMAVLLCEQHAAESLALCRRLRWPAEERPRLLGTRCERCGRISKTCVDSICGTCRHREMRRQNTQEMWGRGRRGY